jgi:hypothetical protein
MLDKRFDPVLIIVSSLENSPGVSRRAASAA